MSQRDATEHYFNSIADQPLPVPEQQLRWARCIDRAQRGFNHAVSECPTAARRLLAYCRDEQGRGGAQRVLARCVLPQTLPHADNAALLDSCLDALEQGVARNCAVAIRDALSPLRLRSECMSNLCMELHVQGIWNAEIDRCLALAARRLARIRAATEHLVRANQRLVVMLARRYRNGPLAFLDLVQEGNLGLLRAIERFDPAHGARVSTYAIWWVRRAMIYAIARQGRDVRPSVTQYWTARQMMRSIDRLEREQGRRVTHRETARHLGMSVAAIQESIAPLAPPLRLDAPIEGTDDVDRIERLAADTPDPEQMLIDNDLRRAVDALLDQLPERHAKILRMRFGIGVHDDCTLEQIARQQGVTRERIRQIEAQALAALRKLDAAWVLRELCGA